MLYHLHVKDLALIDSQDVEFGDGLNILTGETGAGKSILVDSINLALGQKARKDIIRSGKEEGFVELVFGELPDRVLEKLEELDIAPEEGQIIIRRKITKTRSEIKINDCTSTLQTLKSITELLIDIHGQHEHQSLLKEGSHLTILDDFMIHETGELRDRVKSAYKDYADAVERLANFDINEGERQRELDFLEFEIKDIEDACLIEGEEEELSQKYKKYRNSKRIYSSIGEARDILESCDLHKAVSELSSVLEYDESLKDISDSMYDLESIASDTLKSLSDYMDDNEYDEEDFHKVEERLDYIRSVMMKYGGTVEKTEKTLSEKKQRLRDLTDYDKEKALAEKDLAKKKEMLIALSEELSKKRQKGALVLADRIRGEMVEMGFLDVRFELAFSRLEEPTAKGLDSAHFEISLNPGEPMRPLSEVASGGELSRIMLSIKTVLADVDEIPTLIFDEIDTGISGRTAEKVSEKLAKIAKNHQVILITHLPQIAARADINYLIEKHSENGHTHTEIQKLDEEGSVQELSRLLAGGHITEASIAAARELKDLARNSAK